MGHIDQSLGHQLGLPITVVHDIEFYPARDDRNRGARVNGAAVRVRGVALELAVVALAHVQGEMGLGGSQRPRCAPGAEGWCNIFIF